MSWSGLSKKRKGKPNPSTPRRAKKDWESKVKGEMDWKRAGKRDNKVKTTLQDLFTLFENIITLFSKNNNFHNVNAYLPNSSNRNPAFKSISITSFIVFISFGCFVSWFKFSYKFSFLFFILFFIFYLILFLIYFFFFFFY